MVNSHFVTSLPLFRTHTVPRPFTQLLFTAITLLRAFMQAETKSVTSSEFEQCQVFAHKHFPVAFIAMTFSDSPISSNVFMQRDLCINSSIIGTYVFLTWFLNRFRLYDIWIADRGFWILILFTWLCCAYKVLLFCLNLF